MQTIAVSIAGLKIIRLETQKKIVLTIAHLDHDEENWNISYDRLAALCQRCHLRYDAKEKARRRKSDKNQLKLEL